MSGYALGQPTGYGLTEQSTIQPGQQGAANPPAAGAGYTLVLSRFDRWRLIAVSFLLTTDSNVANRFPAIEYSGATGTPNMADPVQAAIVASTTAQRNLGALNFHDWKSGTGLDNCFPLSGLWLEAGSTVKIVVANIQVGDQLSNIRLTFDRWPGGGYVPASTDE